MTEQSANPELQPRSFLFVPANDQRKLAKARGNGADALIIDLEDSVAADAKAPAREMAGQFLGAHIWNKRRPRLYVRINDLGTGLVKDDLNAVLSERPDGIMLPKANSGADIVTLAGMIEEIGGEAARDTGIVAIATETPAAVLQLQSFVGSHPRLKGLTWGSEDLGTALGVETTREASGQLTAPFQLARSLCLIAAHAAGVQPIDSIYADFRDEAGLARESAEAARDGFTGKMAIHPAQISVINAAFTPGAEAIAQAKKIVEAFAANPEAGTIGLDGKMIDRPHLLRAERLLARARAFT